MHHPQWVNRMETASFCNCQSRARCSIVLQFKLQLAVACHRDTVVENRSLKQHTPSCAASLVSTLTCVHPCSVCIYQLNAAASHSCDLWWPQWCEGKFTSDCFYISHYPPEMLSDHIWRGREEKVKRPQWSWNEEHIFSCTVLKRVGVGSGS